MVRFDRLFASASVGIALGACSAIATFDGRPAHLTNAPADDGGSDVLTADGVNSGGSSDCPGTAGPTPVRVGTFCIDSTEVTNAQYAAFLATRPNAAGLPHACDNKTSFAPANNWRLDEQGSHPVLGVDWCDAAAFCRWAGSSDLACAATSREVQTSGHPDVGFRCCSP
jgi:hypothetical protein